VSGDITEFDAEIVTLGERSTKLVKRGSLAGAAAVVSAGVAVYFGLKAHWAAPAAVISSLDIPQSILSRFSDVTPEGGGNGGSPLIPGALTPIVSLLTGTIPRFVAPLGFIVGVPMIFLSEDGAVRSMGKLLMGVGMLLTGPMLMFSLIGTPDSDSSAPQMSPRQVFVQAVDSQDTKWLRQSLAKPPTVADQYVLAQLAVVDRSAEQLGDFARTMSINPEVLQHSGVEPRPDVAYAIDRLYFGEPRSTWARSYSKDSMDRVRRFRSLERAEIVSSGFLLAIALGLLGVGRSIRARLRRIGQLQERTRMLRFSDLSEDQLVQALRLFPGANSDHPFHYVLDDAGNILRREQMDAVLT
jgi:hypothetical protein